MGGWWCYLLCLRNKVWGKNLRLPFWTCKFGICIICETLRQLPLVSELREMLWSEEITLGVLSTNSILLLNPWELIWFPQSHARGWGLLCVKGGNFLSWDLFLMSPFIFKISSLIIGFYRVLPYPLDLPKLSCGLNLSLIMSDDKTKTQEVK